MTVFNKFKTTSFWVGIKRGCPLKTDGSFKPSASVDAPEAHGFKIGATGMTKLIRSYLATNTAAKAKDNAKYPDAGTNIASTTGTAPLAFAKAEKDAYESYSTALNATYE